MTPEYKKTAPYPDPYRPIPLFPIYGYDNSEEAERDFEYMKQLYPRSSHRIQELVEDTCDQMEYEGSMMFDEYPDQLQMRMLCARISRKVRDQEGKCHEDKWKKGSWLEELIQVLTFHEIIKRRGEYRKYRRKFY